MQEKIFFNILTIFISRFQLFLTDSVLVDIEVYLFKHCLFSYFFIGSPLNAPENTRASFEQAKKEGVDLIEFDVGFTKDFVPVLMHDDDLDRTTNMTGPLNKYNFVELEKCNCAAKFRFFKI